MRGTILPQRPSPLFWRAARYTELAELAKQLLGRRKWLFVAAALLALASAIAEGIGLSLIYPLLSSVLGGKALTGELWGSVSSILGSLSIDGVVEGLMLLAVIVFFIKALLLLASTAVINLLVGLLRLDWSIAVLTSYLYGPYGKIVIERRGRIAQKVVGEATNAARAIEQVISFSVQIIFAVVLVATLLFLNWKTTLAIALALLLFTFGLSTLLMKPIKRLARKRLSAAQKLMATATESIQGAEVVKLLGLEDAFIERLRKPLRSLTKVSVLQAVIKKGPSSFVEFIIITSGAIALAIISQLFAVPLAQAIPIIGAFALISARLLMVMTSLLNKRLDLASIVPSLTIVRTAIEQRDLANKHRQGAVLRTIDGNIEFIDVNFAYNAEQPVFSRLSLVIPQGRLVAVVGRSGVGKSTLGYLLTRLYDPDSGEIRINGRDIRDYSLASLRSRIGYVEQSPTIFNGTVEENIRLGAISVTDDQIRAAADAVGIHDFILTMPNGYGSQIEDHGATLSGGQRQRLALARALVRRPELYIIDEGTSALDRTSESVLLDTMRKIANTATVLFITHRVASTEGADLIYEFRAGEAVLREFHEVA